MSNSKVWLPTIKKLIDSQFSKLSKKDGGRYLEITENFMDDIEKMYDVEYTALKKRIFNQKIGYKEEIVKSGYDKVIDRHKIAALYMKTILKVKPISFNIGMYNKDRSKETPLLSVRLSTEYIAILVLIAIISSWNRDQEKKIKDFTLELGSKYAEQLYKLLHYFSYRERVDSFPPLAFSHIVYLIETMNFEHYHEDSNGFFE